MPPPLASDRAVVTHAVDGYGALVAAVALHACGAAAVIDRADAIGARIEMAHDNPWYHAAVVRLGARAPSEDPALPFCLWSTVPVPGRVAAADLMMPAMAIRLDAALPDSAEMQLEEPPLALLGAINDRAYGQRPTLEVLLPGFDDPRCHRFGLRRDGEFACVGLAVVNGSDMGLHYVATETAHRGKGLATTMMCALLHWGRARGLATATLQASVDGLPIYRRLGFEQVETLQGYLRL